MVPCPSNQLPLILASIKVLSPAPWADESIER